MTPTPPPTPDDKLLPCPFCGAAAKSGYIRDGRRIHCTNGDCVAGGPARFHGPVGMASAEDRAIAAWNTRAALRPPEPSPIRTKLPSPCDDEALERELVEAVKIARTSDAKYVSDILDATSVLNIVLQITEGSDILDRLIERHLNDHFATLADATAQVIERDFPESKPQPSPDDAAVLDDYDLTCMTGTLDAKMKARAAVIARMAGKVPQGCMAIPEAAWAFLTGVGELEGCTFGDRHPTRSGAFWWRSAIRDMALPAAPAPEGR